MEKQIKAIETRYAGKNFRSRLEARWSIYFDALGVLWEYETEGYELPSGKRYLPDFWFPKYKCYGEVKPIDFESDERHPEFVKAIGKPLLVFIGNPGQRPNEIFEMHSDGTDPSEADGYAFADVVWGSKYGLFFYGGHSLSETWDQMPEYIYAIDEANTARFEHKAKERVKSYAKGCSEGRDWDYLREEFRKTKNLETYRTLR